MLSHLVNLVKYINKEIKYLHSSEFHAEVFFLIRNFCLGTNIAVPPLKKELIDFRIRCCELPMNLTLDCIIGINLATALCVTLQLIFSQDFLTFILPYELSYAIIINIVLILLALITVFIRVLSEPSIEELRLFYKDERDKYA